MYVDITGRFVWVIDVVLRETGCDIECGHAWDDTGSDAVWVLGH